MMPVIIFCALAVSVLIAVVAARRRANKTGGASAVPNASTGGSPAPAPDREAAVSASESGAFSRHYADDNVQFTVYRPKTLAPMQWQTLLAFAHLSEARAEDGPNAPDPVQEMQRQARQVLQRDWEQYSHATQDSSRSVPRAGGLTFAPDVEGVEFNPPRHTFLWEESVHRAEFRLRARPELEGTTARGKMTVFLGSILIAEVTLSLRVDSAPPASVPEQSLEPVVARPYRKIFASYSHKDLPIVAEFERFAQAVGDRYLRDWVHLRAGEDWNDGLMQLIEEADVFQLFWSSNSMTSPFVRQEWEHALALNRPNFIRPTYWEQPLPTLPEQNLPPEELLRLHFQRLDGDGNSPHAPLTPHAAPPMLAAMPPAPVAPPFPGMTAPAMPLAPQPSADPSPTQAGAFASPRPKSPRAAVRATIGSAALLLFAFVLFSRANHSSSVSNGAATSAGPPGTGAGSTRTGSRLSKVQNMAASMHSELKTAVQQAAYKRVRSANGLDEETLKGIAQAEIKRAFKSRLSREDYRQTFEGMTTWENYEDIFGQEWLEGIYSSAKSGADKRIVELKKPNSPEHLPALNDR